MDPIQAHNNRQQKLAGDLKSLRDVQMGRGPEGPVIDYTNVTSAADIDAQVPVCPNCGQKHWNDTSRCPAAIGERRE